MTNYNKLVSMSIDELAEWLDKNGSFDESPWGKWFNTNYCSNCDSVIVKKENAKELLGFELLYTNETECAYCEVHNKCRYFHDMEYAPSNKEIIKMWLIQPEGVEHDNSTENS